MKEATHTVIFSPSLQVGTDKKRQFGLCCGLDVAYRDVCVCAKLLARDIPIIRLPEVFFFFNNGLRESMDLKYVKAFSCLRM